MSKSLAAAAAVAIELPPKVAAVAQGGGRGIAGRLVRAALEFARGEGHRVRPSCEYAASWMTRHPEFDALRAG